MSTGLVIKGNPRILRIIAFAMLAVSMVLIVLGIYFYMEKDKLLKAEYTLIKCKITKINEYERGEVELTLADVNGNYPPFPYYIHYDASESDLEDIEYKVGQVREVYYHKKDPAKTEIKSFIDNYETGFILLMIGIVFLIDFPILLLVSSFSRKQQNQAQSQNFGIKGSVISQ
jgi:hypothetical protein